MLSDVLDKLCEYLLRVVDAAGDAHRDIRLRRVMDVCAEQIFGAHIDSQARGYCYGFEIFEYMNNPSLIFRELHLTDLELSVFMRFVGQVAGMNLEEAGSVMKAQIKWSFLLAQLEQNFYIRLATAKH